MGPARERRRDTRTGENAIVTTGLVMALPNGTYGRIASRSGLSAKKNIEVHAGVIDQDYRGEVKMILFNHSPDTHQLKAGDRIAQMVVEYVVPTKIKGVSQLESTERAEKGFGSTGEGKLMMMQKKDRDTDQSLPEKNESERLIAKAGDPEELAEEIRKQLENHEVMAAMARTYEETQNEKKEDEGETRAAGPGIFLAKRSDTSSRMDAWSNRSKLCI